MTTQTGDVGGDTIDSTLGISSRETRSFATPITVFATGGVVSLALREMHVNLRERRLRHELAQLENTLNGAQH